MSISYVIIWKPSMHDTIKVVAEHTLLAAMDEAKRIIQLPAFEYGDHISVHDLYAVQNGTCANKLSDKEFAEWYEAAHKKKPEETKGDTRRMIVVKPPEES